ncbi:hypothetical protein M8494_09600 [Serratia ureilytica]
MLLIFYAQRRALFANFTQNRQNFKTLPFDKQSVIAVLHTSLLTFF